MEYSQSERAERAMGRRLCEGIILNSPAEEGFHCLVCDHEHGEEQYDERLEWSEYNGFLWCSVCNRDYPSALCMPDIERAIDIFLASVEAAVQRRCREA